MDLKINLDRTGISKEDLKAYAPKIDSILGKLWSDKEDFTGWVKLPMKVNKDEMEKILNAAVTIQQTCEEFIVLGVGGSYLGARAAIQAVVGPDEVRGTNVPSFTYPKIRFAGQNLSATYLREVLETVRTKETCICVISKSGDTLEPTIAFEILREEIEAKYKEKAAERIFVITDKEHGTLRADAEEKGYTTFEVPANVGGRYSVLTP
ncbi:MAG: glucose-6-phosphate isomerase, partial [Lachnospiraceae bacterium]|nr:glucose-6-phosphate isomerase [Lachnospiraceae bacterium]